MVYTKKSFMWHCSCGVGGGKLHLDDFSQQPSCQDLRDWCAQERSLSSLCKYCSTHECLVSRKHFGYGGATWVPPYPPQECTHLKNVPDICSILWSIWKHTGGPDSVHLLALGQIRCLSLFRSFLRCAYTLLNIVEFAIAY